MAYCIWNRRCHDTAVRWRTQWPNAPIATIHAEFSRNVRVSIHILHTLGLAAQSEDTMRGANAGVLFLLLWRRFFMSIGSVIRTEGVSSQSMEAYMRATRRYPIVIQSLDEKREASWLSSSLKRRFCEVSRGFCKYWGTLQASFAIHIKNWISRSLLLCLGWNGLIFTPQGLVSRHPPQARPPQMAQCYMHLYNALLCIHKESAPIPSDIYWWFHCHLRIKILPHCLCNFFLIEERRCTIHI